MMRHGKIAEQATTQWRHGESKERNERSFWVRRRWGDAQNASVRAGLLVQVNRVTLREDESWRISAVVERI